jgi:ABC-type Na+ transport system ATPase subunit NatA
MWLFYMTWSASLISFCYALSTLFSSAKVASVLGSLLYILSWAPALVATSGSGAHGSAAWTLVCLCPASGIYMWGLALARLEDAEVGLTWASLFRDLTAGGAAADGAAFSAGGVLLVTAAGGVCSAAAAWYLDKAAPRQHGAARLPWTFPLSRAYWCCSSAAVAPLLEAPPASKDADTEAAAVAGGVERARVDAPHASVVLRSLCKRYPSAAPGGADVLAVDNLSVSFYPGELTTLLGHNGAGKTTTLSVLSGLTPPSGGAATVGGLDVATHMLGVRRSLGVCPQHDVLWPTLSCAEHLALYAAFRGVPRAAVAAEAARILEEVGLAEKASAPAGTLSGGQRRKLSLAIAFVGGPTTVLLDEPTSGAFCDVCRRVLTFASLAYVSSWGVLAARVQAWTRTAGAPRGRTSRRRSRGARCCSPRTAWRVRP